MVGGASWSVTDFDSRRNKLINIVLHILEEGEKKQKKRVQTTRPQANKTFALP